MISEIRHALRRLRATPIVTLSAIACLSIGVWMTCVVTAVGRGFFRPYLGIHAADRLIQIDEQGLFIDKARGRPEFSDRIVSKTVLDSIVARGIFAAIGYYTSAGGLEVSPTDYRQGVMLSSGMMDVLAMPIELGRRFVPADDSTPVVIISHGL